MCHHHHRATLHLSSISLSFTMFTACSSTSQEIITISSPSSVRDAPSPILTLVLHLHCPQPRSHKEEKKSFSRQISSFCPCHGACADFMACVSSTSVIKVVRGWICFCGPTECCPSRYYKWRLVVYSASFAQVQGILQLSRDVPTCLRQQLALYTLFHLLSESIGRTFAVVSDLYRANVKTFLTSVSSM